MKNLILASATAIALSACYVVPMSSGSQVVQTPVAQSPASPQETVLNARLYPNNTAAQNAGAGSATVSITHTGHGTFRAQIGAESFTGDATRTLNSRSGKANGTGSMGRYINCNYTMNSETVGTGTCTTSAGASYNMHISR
ncbi:hypothetical protein [Alysiella filiformis]|uniref:Uncharacterized protein n=1 Tax=Alysiella filiformis DSM 16848 TaxID=1120981 RepID=A0A286EGI7_9NEIS|nr:hypothetical protein [Alysiella filiformis]QMT31785.1 hypothetical protein H3L97_02540 [Alysiella filiformis]UBQ55201.1 hypothetical protein JF568_06140 [Alysiella filiformis DSM 16848]SOD70023.1 hypothetical protein SAMN02746062_01932 [Alysiella filiformis DSM 16848]